MTGRRGAPDMGTGDSGGHKGRGTAEDTGDGTQRALTGYSGLSRGTVGDRRDGAQRTLTIYSGLSRDTAGF